MKEKIRVFWREYKWDMLVYSLVVVAAFTLAQISLREQEKNHQQARDEFLEILREQSKVEINNFYFGVEETTIKETVVASEIPKATPTPKPKKGFSQYQCDEYLLAQIIFCEAGGEGAEEMRLAGSVVINRARTNYKDFKDVSSIPEVLYQGYGTKQQQYSPITIEKIESGIEPSKAAKKVAKGLLRGDLKCLPEKVLFQTDFVPKWDVEIINIPGADQVYSAPSDF